jgi:hypothetical protein
MTASRFSPRSRYAGVGTTTTVGADGREVVHLRRRFPPQPDALTTVARRVVIEGERIDNVAAAELGDPTAWWQLADANNVRDPDDLVAEPGAIVRITLPAALGSEAGGTMVAPFAPPGAPSA